MVRPKLDTTFNKPIGLCLDRAPHIDSTLFVGRATELSEMHHALTAKDSLAGQRRLVLGGLGGVGKTQLAIAYAKQKCDHYDSIFWLNATSEATLTTSFKSMAERLFDVQDLQNLANEQIVAGVKQWLSHGENTRWLLIFDNYDEPKSYDLLAYYPQASSHGAIVVTTRLPDEVGSEPFILKSIQNVDESLEILEKRSKRENVKAGQLC